MGFNLSLVDLAIENCIGLLLLLNLIKSAALDFVNNHSVYLINLIFFIMSRVDKASAADTVDLDSITGLVKSKLENSLCSHPASRLNIYNKMGSVKFSPCEVNRWANDSLFSKNERFFCCLLTTW